MGRYEIVCKIMVKYGNICEGMERHEIVWDGMGKNR